MQKKPMQKIVTDVTYIKHKGKWHYLACYLDLYNNEILDYELSETFDKFLVMKTAKRILEKAKSTDTTILFHSDQGVQYSSAGYCNYFQYWKCDNLQKVIDEAVHYFNYIKPLRKLNRKPPVQYRLEQAV